MLIVTHKTAIVVIIIKLPVYNKCSNARKEKIPIYQDAGCD